MSNRRLPRELSLPAIALLVLLAILWWMGRPGADNVGAPQPSVADAYRPPAMAHIRLTFSKPELWRLRLKREQALRRGVLIAADGDWVRATLHEGRGSWPVSVRLKGDWTDHLKGGKWSFRVRMRRDTAWRGMTVFSLQNPETRDFLSEWLFHRVLRQEGVLSPRYDFVRLSVNGSDLGTYALEEHFTKQLLESQGRREGPLLKFNESGMWEARVEALRDPRFPYLELPLYEAAEPEAFQSSRHRNPDDLRADSSRRVMMIALNLLHEYKYGLAPAGQIFDLDLVARQYALTDLFHGHHSLVWHNRRFAYNPILCRLEPVVYDAFAGEISGLYLNGPFTGYASNGNTSYGRREDLLGTCFFREQGFVEAYYRYLWQWTDPGFLDGLKAEYMGEWRRREKFLRREFLAYRYDFGEVEGHAREIRQALTALEDAQFELERVAENRVCLQNYAPLAVMARFSGEKGWHLLGAYDKVGGAEWVELEGDPEKEVEVRVAGVPEINLKLAPAPR